MKCKTFTAAILETALLLTLAACGKYERGDVPPQESPFLQQTEQSEEESTADAEDAWKTDFEKSLLENYGVTPDHYEDLGDGVYQVYVKINGKVVPYVAVDSATGDYHG